MYIYIYIIDVIYAFIIKFNYTILILSGIEQNFALLTIYYKYKNLNVRTVNDRKKYI